MDDLYWLADYECHGCCGGHGGSAYCPGWEKSGACAFIKQDNPETLDNHLSGSLAPMKDRSYE